MVDYRDISFGDKTPFKPILKEERAMNFRDTFLFLLDEWEREDRERQKQREEQERREQRAYYALWEATTPLEEPFNLDEYEDTLKLSDELTDDSEWGYDDLIDFNDFYDYDYSGSGDDDYEW